MPDRQKFIFDASAVRNIDLAGPRVSHIIYAHLAERRMRVPVAVARELGAEDPSRLGRYESLVQEMYYGAPLSLDRQASAVARKIDGQIFGWRRVEDVPGFRSREQLRAAGTPNSSTAVALTVAGTSGGVVVSDDPVTKEVVGRHPETANVLVVTTEELAEAMLRGSLAYKAAGNDPAVLLGASSGPARRKPLPLTPRDMAKLYFEAIEATALRSPGCKARREVTREQFEAAGHQPGLEIEPGLEMVRILQGKEDFPRKLTDLHATERGAVDVRPTPTVSLQRLGAGDGLSDSDGLAG